MRTSSYLLGFFATSFVALLPGCGDVPPTVSGGDDGISGDGDKGKGGVCESETEEECPCPNGQPDGLRYCYEGQWLSCSCDKDENGGSTVAGSDCKPGRYEGEFFGYYFSSYTGGFAPIPVWALGGLDGKPGLAFTLNANGAAPVEGQEFAEELEISDGYVKGTADGLFPFEGKLTGKLNCKTKEFRATLKGGYAVLIDVPGVTTADFEGPVFGKYDVKASAFPCQAGTKNFPKCDDPVELRATGVVADAVASTPYPNKKYPSTWELIEKTTLMSPFPNIPLGGKGYWSAQWIGDGHVDTNTGMATKP